MVEAVEPVIKTRKCYSVESQSREILGEIQLCPWLHSGPMSTRSGPVNLMVLTFGCSRIVPFQTQLLGDIFHIVKHVPDAERAKVGQQNAMSNAPGMAIMVCSEKTVACDRSQAFKSLCHQFVKPLLITQFSTKRRAADKGFAFPKQGQREYRA